jgi:uncharacterized protein
MSAAGRGPGTRPEPMWPQDLLDVAAHRRAGHPPLPFREFVVKVHSRCNLACSYCYVYESVDQGWRSQPVTMAERTARAVRHRIAEHAGRHRPSSVRVILHGGEPLLAGVGFLGRFARDLRAELPSGVRADVLVQTNGILVDDRVLDMCRASGLRLGVSLDGDRDVHDRARLDRVGRGSHARVAAVLHRLARPENRPLWAGILCTVDPAADPIAVYEHLLSYDPPAIGLLLPLGDWTHPPPERVEDSGEVPYAAWLSAVFDRWYRASGPRVRVSLFESVLDRLLGGPSRSEVIGGAPAQVAVVDTDGAITLSDHLKTAYPGADRTGLDVFDAAFDELLDHPGVVARQLGTAGLCDRCRACPVKEVCGGGHYPHRFRAGAGFLNPSVYCPDLLAFIGHVADTVRADLAGLPGVADRAGRGERPK